MKMHENRNSSNMDAFYEENGQQFVATTQPSNTATQRAGNNLKRPISLDLNLATNNNHKGPAGNKKLRLNQSVIPQAILNSPDLNMLKWGTPDLEKYILSSDPLQTPTPSLMFGANPIGAAKEVTNEQEEYAQPFVDALNSLHNSEKHHQQPQQQQQQQQQQHQPSQQQSQQQQPQPPQPQSQPSAVREFSSTAGTTGAIVANPAIITTTTTSTTILSKVGMSGGSVTYTNLEDNYPVTIKDEPQTVPNSPPMSPIDMESQEKIKLERKRQRNRVAASKCRKRKLERISKLEDKVKQLKGENVELGGVIKSLKEHVIQLKQKVIEHINNGCSIPTYNNTAYFVRPTKVSDSDIK